MKKIYKQLSFMSLYWTLTPSPPIWSSSISPGVTILNMHLVSKLSYYACIVQFLEGLLNISPYISMLNFESLEGA